MSRKPSIWKRDVSDLLSFGRRRKIPLRELAVFCRKAAFLLDAGLPLKEAVPILAEQTGGALEAAFSNVHSKVMQGESFSHALRVENFPPFMCGYIEIGEHTARLPEVCARLASYYEARAQSEDELSAAMLYPIAVALVMSAVIVLAVTFVLPGYSQIFEASGVALPALTSGLLALSHFLRENFFVVFGAVLGVIFLAAGLFRTKKGRLVSARIRLKIPLVSQNISLNIAQALSLLLQSGVGVSEAISMCAGLTGNPVVKNDFGKLAARVNSGADFSEALRGISYINPLLAELSRVGENIGRLPQTVEKCSAYLEEQYRHSIRRMNKLIEPIITLVLGGILAAVMLAIILPTFQLATAV